MKRYLSVFIILLISCSFSANEEIQSELLEEVGESANAITETTFDYLDTSESVVTENFTDKKTIIIFWADY